MRIMNSIKNSDTPFWPILCYLSLLEDIFQLFLSVSTISTPYFIFLLIFFLILLLFKVPKIFVLGLYIIFT